MKLVENLIELLNKQGNSLALNTEDLGKEYNCNTNNGIDCSGIRCKECPFCLPN